ncbi:hypothetical protein D3C81_359270 [compost metagenome]|uniref:Uncharacterized protein n=1 Tax=Serratia liquefaciens TaxID=614 RepID=A0ABX7DDQ0_SERLI|nr:putative holin [Serratia liquefaciens]QQU58036.1 hypothetical protein I6I38_25070 [Serratia liquefaciens]
MIEELLSALSGAVVFIINQDYYQNKKVLVAFLASFFMGVLGGEFSTTLLTSYLETGKNLSIELCAFLTSAFIIPVCRVVHTRILK